MSDDEENLETLIAETQAWEDDAAGANQLLTQFGRISRLAKRMGAVGSLARTAKESRDLRDKFRGEAAAAEADCTKRKAKAKADADAAIADCQRQTEEAAKSFAVAAQQRADEHAKRGAKMQLEHDQHAAALKQEKSKLESKLAATRNAVAKETAELERVVAAKAAMRKSLGLD